MFSYFSSSKVDDTVENTKLNEGVTAVATSATEQSNISDDESGDNIPMPQTTHCSRTPVVCTTWNQAHDEFCSKHGTLKASIREILSETCGENQEIPWELPRRSDANLFVEAKEVAELLRSKRTNTATMTVSTPAKSSISSLLMSPLKVVSAVASIMRDPDDDIDEWVQDGDDAFIDDEDNYTEDNSSSSSSNFGLNTPIFNLKRTESLIDCLERNIDQIPTETPLVMGFAQWNTWVSSSLSKFSALNESNLSTHDQDVLLQVLVELKRAKIIRREPKGLDVIVLTSKTMEDEKDGFMPENVRIALSLWDIQIAEEKIEQKLKEWSEQAVECTRKALVYKKRNQMKIAATQLAKRRMIQQRIDSDSRLQLQLLQTRNAIESAQSNRSVIDLMADSAKMLRQLREQTPLEEVDETIDDLQSELDDLQDINDKIATVGNNFKESYTDDELLAELQSLSINDSVPVATASTMPGNKEREKPRGIVIDSEKSRSDSLEPQKQPVLS